DPNYVVGFNYVRQWQIRAVGDVAPGISLGVSVENPAAIFLGSTATAPLGTGGAFPSGGIVNGQVVNFVNTGGGGDFLQTVNVTTDQAPDIIEKAAFDPGWGHYEIYGLQRFFSDNVLRCVLGACVAGSTAMVGTPDNKTTFGAGVGGSVLLPLSAISRIHGQRPVRPRSRPLRGGTAAGCHHRSRRLALTGEGMERNGGPYRPSVGRARRLRLLRRGAGRRELLQRQHHAVRPWQSGIQQRHVSGHDAVLICRQHARRLHREQQNLDGPDGGLLAERLQGRLWPRGLRRPVRIHQA